MLSRPLRRLGVLSGLAVPLGLLAAAGGQAPAAASGVPSSLAAAVREAELPALEAIGAPAAWRLSRGQGVTVGVLDTGVGAGAPDLTGTVTSGPDYTAGVDPPGYQPPHLHGTFIASLIAGHGSGLGRVGGVIGVAPAARVLSVRVLPDDQEPGFRVYNENPRYQDAVSRGIRYAVRRGVSVINMSLGSPAPTRSLRAAVGYAISHGVVVVAAAGNGGSAGGRFSPYSYPAAYPGVISVAAVSGGGTRAPFSDRNASVVIAAPGVSVIGAAPGGNYVQADGTSPASAFVAGVAALIRSEYPKLPPALVAQALITSTRHRPRGGYSPGTGFGEVYAPAALAGARRLAAQRPAAGEPPSARLAAAGGPVRVVHRDALRVYGYGAVSAAAMLGFLAALLAFVMLARRSLRDRRAAAGPPGGTAAVPGPGPAQPWPPPTGPPRLGQPGD
jgi:subtilisin family serine protease